jgi:hypothetical protein
MLFTLAQNKTFLYVSRSKGTQCSDQVIFLLSTRESCRFSHPPLIDVNWLHETQSILWLTNPVLTFALLFIVGPIILQILFRKSQNMIKSSEQWYDYTLPEWLADVTDLVNISNACTHWRSSIGRGQTIVWVHGRTCAGSVGGSNYRLVVNGCNRSVSFMSAGRGRREAMQLLCARLDVNQRLITRKHSLRKRGRGDWIQLIQDRCVRWVLWTR